MTKLPIRTAPLSLALFVAATLPALAQERKLDEVVVTAAPDAPSTANLDGADLRNAAARTSDTASLLEGIPGVSLYGAGGVSSLPAIHGLADDRVRTTVDGVDLVSTCPNHMNSPLSYMDPTAVGSVKVFAGIAPVSAGGDGIGGAVQVDAPPPEFAAAGEDVLRKGSVGAFYRSNGNGRGINLGATLAGENVALTYAGATAQADDYQAARDFKAGTSVTNNQGKTGQWLAGDTVGSSRFKSVNQSLGVALRQRNHLFEFKATVQDVPYEGYPNQRMDMTRNDSTLLNLRYLGQYDWGTLEGRVYDHKTRHRMDFGDDKRYWYGAAGNIAGMPMETEGRNTGALLKASILLSERDLLRVGGEYQRYRLNDWWPPVANSALMSPNTFWNVSDGKRDRYEAFVEWEARWSPEWLSQLGIRGGTVKSDAGNVQGYGNAAYATDASNFNARSHARTDRNWDLTALARYTPASTRSFEGGYARKTRSPNLYERYTWTAQTMASGMNNFAGDGNGYVGNLDLKPEVAHTFSLTADWHDAAWEAWNFKATPFYTHVQDYIDARRCPTSFSANCTVANLTTTTQFVDLQFVNQSARLYGIDLSGRIALGRSAGFGSFSATGVLNYVRGKNRTTGDNLYNIMPLNARLAVVQKLGRWTGTAELQLVDAKTEVAQVRNELRTAGYGLFNLRASYEWQQARLDVGIENLFNRFYNLPLGGAYVGQGSTMTFNSTGPAWGTPVPGMGRSLNTALNVRF